MAKAMPVHERDPFDALFPLPSNRLMQCFHRAFARGICGCRPRWCSGFERKSDHREQPGAGGVGGA